MNNHILGIIITIATSAIFLIPVNAQTAGKFTDLKISNCAGSQLSLKEIDSEGEMGGKVLESFVFTNISSTACTLSGFPEVVLLNKSGKVMRGVKTINNSDSGDDKPATIIIETKQTAWFQILYSTGKMGYDPPKNPPSAYKMKIIAPKTGKSFVMKSGIAPYKQIMVTAIRAGLPE